MSNTENRPAARRAARLGLEQASLLDLVLIAGAVVLAAAFYLYWRSFGALGWSNKQEVWGQAGDFIGGVCNPLLSLLALLALLKTVRLQSAQLDAAREELEEARRAQERADQRQLEQLQAARDLAQAQERAAVAMERAAAAQEKSAAAIEAQLALASGTAASQHTAATAQFAAALFGVAVGAKEGGYPGPGSDLVELHNMKPDAVQLIKAGLSALLSGESHEGSVGPS
jgi:hypothetical protein